MKSSLRLLGATAFLLLVIWAGANAFAQETVLRSYERGDIHRLEQLRSRKGTQLDGYSRRFLDNLFKQDAALAISGYKSLIKERPKAPVVPYLLERIGQYQFSLGLYNTARETFQFLASHYPNQPSGERALYYVARCWQAIGRTDSSRFAISTLRNRYPRSPYLQLMQLRPGVLVESPAAAKKKSAPGPSVFTVQAGAFTSYSNAKIQKQFLENKGYKAEIFLKEVGNRTFYVVCTGRFDEEEGARKFADRLKRRYHIQYQIADLKLLRRLK